MLGGIRSQPGQDVPVGETITWLLAPGEALPEEAAASQPQAAVAVVESPAALLGEISPLARRIAGQHGVDLAQVKGDGGRIQKKDVLAYLQAQQVAPPPARLTLASPKARRLVLELGLAAENITGSGLQGAVLAADVQAAHLQPAREISRQSAVPANREPAGTLAESAALPVSGIWRVMVERISQAWREAQHFYLAREANASRLVAWREMAQKRAGVKITITDLLVKLAASALAQHPRLAARWENGQILAGGEINIGLAIAIEDGLTVPVVHRAGALSLRQISQRRQELVERAQAGRLKQDELTGGVFAISNLGMYGTDAFNDVVNPPRLPSWRSGASPAGWRRSTGSLPCSR